ncbi:MAG: hypothetical protein M1133_09435 [Armatimonadetes bacterium]|nr:hypothetical protein [Armatimonadota bacterium]
MNRLQTFLVRNSELLPTDALANYLGTDEVVVQGWLRELGLPEMETVDRERVFPLVVRRNHDLLPDEEIAKLLGMSMGHYRRTMLEMDYLDIKVGNKPAGLTGIEADREGWNASAAAHFRSCSQGYFSDYIDWEKRFGFLDEFAQVEEPILTGGSEPEEPRIGLKMMYSYTATHGDFLLSGEEFYSEGILSRLRNRGVNAGWMPGLLRDLAPSGIFPEFGESHEIRIANLRKQVEKAQTYGIKLFLYLNEPRFMPEEFFDKYPESKGMRALQDSYYGMCTSDPRVREWLHESIAFIFSQVPDLGGVVVISASENRTNCYSHSSSNISSGRNVIGFGDEKCKCTCPRCMQRGAEEVLADAANIFGDALDSIGSEAEVIEWVWGWDFVLPVDAVKKAIGKLSDRVTVMVDWARHTRFNLFGKEATVIEYTLAYPQPSDYALDIIEATKLRGRRVLSKCSLVSTVEMNALPYLPVLSNVQELLLAIRDNEVDGLLGCWIFGAYPGRNMEMLAHVNDPSPLESLAAKYYGSSASEAVKAWDCFSSGMKYFPTIISVLYHSALNSGPGVKFRLEPAGWQFGMVAVPTERIEEICKPLGSDVVIKGFRKCAESFAQGLVYLEYATQNSDIEQYKQDNLRDHAICKACMLHMLTAANHAEFILTRNKWLLCPSDDALRSYLVRILRDELENSEAMLVISKSDSRIGYEGSIGYFYTPSEIIEKIYDIRLAVSALEE